MSFESDNPELELNSTDGFLFETPAGSCPEVLTEVELSTCDDVSFWIGNIRFAVVVAGVILNLESLVKIYSFYDIGLVQTRQGKLRNIVFNRRSA